jgi:hypothetical protein
MKSYSNYNRHEQIFIGWRVSFKMDGKTWKWNLGSRYSFKVDAESRVREKYPNSTDIRCEKILCEV